MALRKLLLSLVWTMAAMDWTRSQEQAQDEPLTTYYRDLRMPGVTTTRPEEYICTALPLNSSVEEWLLGFEPEVTIERAHHMTLFGCADVPQATGVWDCKRHGTVCHRARHISMWSLNAPATALPSGVGFRVGGDSDVQYLTLQIHYARTITDGEDRSGLKIRATTERQPFAAGILILSVGTRGQLPPNTPRAHMDTACQLKSLKVLEDIHVIGNRVHTHKLGTVVKGYRYDVETGEYELITAGNPQWPQAVYPRDEVMTLTPEDVVAVRCTYNTTGIDRVIRAGSSSLTEMCAAYFLYYTEHERVSPWVQCDAVQDRDIISNLPEGSDESLPPNPVLTAKASAASIDKSEVITYPPVAAPSPALRRIAQGSSEDQN